VLAALTNEDDLKDVSARGESDEGVAAQEELNIAAVLIDELTSSSHVSLHYTSTSCRQEDTRTPPSGHMTTNFSLSHNNALQVVVQHSMQAYNTFLSSIRIEVCDSKYIYIYIYIYIHTYIICNRY